MHHRSGPSAADTPLLRVSRPVSACSRCRAAKIKCDGKLPACTACEKSGRAAECSSANDQFAKGKERSYVASLESRVEKLEKKISYARSRKASVAMHDVDEQPSEPADRKDSLATIRAAIHGKAARRREAADVNELVSDFGFLSVNANTRDFESSTTNMTFARLVLAAANNDAIPKSSKSQLPPRASAMALAQWYLDNVFAIFPVFSETAIYNAMDAIYQVNGRSASEFEHWLLYMVLAIGSTGQSRSSRDAFYLEGLAWVSHALRYADKVLVPGYVSQIQALVLLVQYSMLDPAHFDSWQLVGFACRAVVDLGFHQDPPKEQQIDKKTLQMRRKLFYCVYSLDRSISMVHARSFSFSDDSAIVAYPSASVTPSTGATSPVAGPHSLETALLLFQLRFAQSHWYQELFQSSRDPLQNSSTYIWQMCQEMREWSESFPETLPLAFKDFFDLELLYSYVYCLAPSCRVRNVSEYGKTLIFEYSIAYMQKIFPISRDPINKAFYTYHDALRVYFVGSQFLAVLSASQDQLLHRIVPYVPVVPGTPPPPPLPSNTGVDNIDRSINCINHIKETLKTFGHRWDDSQALHSSFEVQAAPLLSSLYRRKHHNEDMRNSDSPSGFMPQQPAYDRRGNIAQSEWNMGQMFPNNNLQASSLQHHRHHYEYQLPTMTMFNETVTGITLKETMKQFWFHSPSKMCKGIEDQSDREKCVTQYQISNAIIGIIWALLWCAIMILILMAALQYFKGRRIMRQTRLNAVQMESDYMATRWHRYGNFAPGSNETQMTGPLERIPRNQPITLDGASDLPTPYIAQRRVGLTIFPPTRRCFSPVPSAYRRSIAPRIPPLSLPKPALATYRMENGIRVASGTSSFQSHAKISTIMPAKDSAPRRGLTIRWISEGA